MVEAGTSLVCPTTFLISRVPSRWPGAKLADKRFGDVFDILVIGVHQHGPVQLPPYEVVVGL